MTKLSARAFQHGPPELKMLESGSISLSGTPEPRQTRLPNRALGTRNICIAALIAQWALGIGSLVLSLYVWWGWRNHVITNMLPGFLVPEGPGFEIAPLAANVVITLVNEGTAYLQATSLRWALHREGRLTFNTNLRLLTSSREFDVNGRFTNTLNVIFLVFSYSSSSVLCRPVYYNDDPIHIGQEFWAFNPVALLILAVGLLGQASIATRVVLRARIPTWSSHPFDTVLACQNYGLLEPQPDRCLMNISERSLPTQPAAPQRRQPPLHQVDLRVRWILTYLWALTVACLLWFGIVYATNRQQGPTRFNVPGTNWSFLPLTEVSYPTRLNLTDPDAPPAVLADMPLYSPQLSFRWGHGCGLDIECAVYTLFLTLLFQSLITLALHSVELLVSLHRDERLWRRATSRQGAPVTHNSILAAASDVPNWVLFAAKAVLHWMYGLCLLMMQTPNSGNGYQVKVALLPAQILYLALILAAFAAAATALCFWRPRGPQPAAYGHAQTLADLIDEWAERIYWGHKGKMEGYVYHAGTAAGPLPPVQMETLYE